MRKKVRWGLLLFTALCCIGFAVYYVLSRWMTDNTAPEISFLSEELEVSVGADEAELLEGVTAWDAHDGDVTDSIVVEGISNLSSDQMATVTYAAFDEAGNVTKARRTLRYTDYHSPRFTLSEPLVFRSGTTFNVFRYIGAEDVIDGTLDDRVKATLVSEEASVMEEGVHQVEFRVTNSRNDTAYLEIPVEVYPSGSYNATLELSDYLVYLDQGAGFDPDAYLKTLRISTGAIDLRDPPDEITVSYDSDVNPKVPGTYSVAYTVTYSGYTESIGYTRLIVVVEKS